LRWLLKNSLSLRSMGVKGRAFNYAAIKKVLALCQDSEIAVWGGYVIALNDRNRPFYNYDNWSIDSDASEDYEAFLKASIGKSLTYIEAYPDKENYLFEIVLCYTKADFIISKYGRRAYHYNQKRAPFLSNLKIRLGRLLNCLRRFRVGPGKIID